MKSKKFKSRTAEVNLGGYWWWAHDRHGVCCIYLLFLSRAPHLWGPEAHTPKPYSYTAQSVQNIRKEMKNNIWAFVSHFHELPSFHTYKQNVSQAEKLIVFYDYCSINDSGISFSFVYPYWSVAVTLIHLVGPKALVLPD